MTETLDAATAAKMTMTADKGGLLAEIAISFADRQNLEVVRYDRAQGLVYLSDGEPYSWAAIVRDHEADLDQRGVNLAASSTAPFCMRCGKYHATGYGMTLYRTARRSEGGHAHLVGSCDREEAAP